jgi:hypothetical protein
LVMVIFAPCITAPEESVTVPVIPLKAWPKRPIDVPRSRRQTVIQPTVKLRPPARRLRDNEVKKVMLGSL